MPDKRRITDTGKYPVFSGYRIVGYYDECNLDGEELVVVARGVGGTGDVKLSPGACFLTNLSIAVVIDETVALKKFLYYYFHNHNLRYLDSGSAQSQITVSDLKNVEVPVPPLETQEKIVSTLEMLDYKIELNQKINRNLLQQLAIHEVITMSFTASTYESVVLQLIQTSSSKSPLIFQCKCNIIAI